MRGVLTTIRNMGGCPCPRCTIGKLQISDIGMKRDDARRVRNERVDTYSHQHLVQTAHDAIYKDGKGVKSVAVDGLLSKESYIPTMASTRTLC